MSSRVIDVISSTRGSVAGLSSSILLRSLSRRGFRFATSAWDAATLGDASAFTLVTDIVGYYPDYDRFLAYVRHTNDLGRVFINSFEQICWGIDKSYLAQIMMTGCPVIETRIIDLSRTALTTVFDSTGWTEVVLKPAQGSSGLNVSRVRRDDQDWSALASLRNARVLVQPFLSDFVNTGEVSGVFLAGSYSHGFRRIVQPGDYRANKRFGARVVPASLDASTVQAMARAVSAIPGLPIFARVDGIEKDGIFLLNEVEVVDPYLAFDLFPTQADLLADIIERL